MWIGLRMLRPETAHWPQPALPQGRFSRAALARELWERDGWRNARGKPFGPDIRSWVRLLARMAGWRPSERQALAGDEGLRRAHTRL